MPLLTVRKKRRSIPSGYRVGNGGCYFEPTNDNDASVTTNRELEALIERRKSRLRSRKEHAASKSTTLRMNSNPINGRGIVM
jgi:hypothetical protein